MTGTHAETKIDRNTLITELKNYHTHYAEERAYIGQFLDLLTNPRCYYRDCFPGHITASSILINQAGDHILMNHHKSLNKWMNFGGHSDGDEDSLSVAIRETMEEAGVTAFKALSADFVDIDIHSIPENSKKGEPAHYHYDVRYVMQMTGEQQAVISDESLNLKWMTWAEARALTGDNDPFQRYITKAEEMVKGH